MILCNASNIRSKPKKVKISNLYKVFLLIFFLWPLGISPEYLSLYRNDQLLDDNTLTKDLNLTNVSFFFFKLKSSLFKEEEIDVHMTLDGGCECGNLCKGRFEWYIRFLLIIFFSFSRIYILTMLFLLFLLVVNYYYTLVIFFQPRMYYYDSLDYDKFCYNFIIIWETSNFQSEEENTN